jgi:oxalate decarboxylase
MSPLKRRELLAAGAAGAVATATGIAVATKGGGSGAPTLPEASEKYTFDLEHAKPQVVREGGTVTLCDQKNFPVVAGNDAAVFLLVLKEGGLREPHWHPNAWEFDYCASGTGTLGVVTPDGEQRAAELKPGDVGFVPQGWAHYIENTGKEDMKFVIVFNNSVPNDVGLSTVFGGMPTETFTETLGLPKDGLAGAAKVKETDFIVP